MLAITLTAVGIVAFKIAQRVAILLVDGIATAVAAWCYWRRERLAPTLLAGSKTAKSADWTLAKTSRAQRRFMARHLRISIGMTAHFSVFPRSSARGYALASRLMAVANHGS